MASGNPDEFHGTARFELLSRLGQGGMGTVYAVFDRERGVRMALKSLSSSLSEMSAERLRLFKKEFRALQDVHHANLVQLGELFEVDGRWFFTMELVEGVDFLTFVRPASGLQHDDSQSDFAPTLPAEPIPPDARLASDTVPAPAPINRSVGYDETRLRSALLQLANGLTALHAARKVHRDIKPSNLMVTPAGRLVILDFGIVSDLNQRDSWGQERLMGTLQYMAPELTAAAGRGVSPAVDWYSVGVVLYVALSGRLPFAGTPGEILDAIQNREPLPVHKHEPTVPHDLDELCSRLLLRDPAVRATGEQILQCLHAKSAPAFMQASTPSGELFVGRAQELHALEQALSDVRSGQGVTILLCGESGVGKSYVVRHFLNRLSGLNGLKKESLVLAGRCYERESVPYKAIDQVIDQLSLYLQHLPAEQVKLLLPSRLGLLAALFPVLNPLLALTSEPDSTIVDAAEKRRSAFAVLREIFWRLSKTVHLTVVVDDLQWADADSFMLLSELLRPPAPPPMLLLATVRTKTTTGGISVKETPLDWLPGDVRRLPIEKLPETDARMLAGWLLRRLGNDGEKLAATIASEAEGHPLFIEELIRFRSDHADAIALRLDETLWRRAQQMEGTARSLLEVVAIAGVPIAQQTALEAAAIAPAEFDAQAAQLRAARLIRTSGARRDDTIEPYHDRVRESVQAHLSDQTKKGWHGRLALALESHGKVDPETLVIHWLGAEQKERAAGYAVKAAEKAAAALAFDRAARLYKQALELGSFGGVVKQELLIKLGEALTNAGLGREAAGVFMTAAEGAESRQASRLRRRAAEQLLRSGYSKQGIELIRQALQDLGMRFRTTMPEVIGSLILHQAWLRIHGTQFKERAEAEVPIDDLERIDALMACAHTLGSMDGTRGAEFSSRLVRLALNAGEPMRVAYALIATATSTAIFGGSENWLRAQSQLTTARELIGRTEQPYPRAYLLNYEGIIEFFAGHFRTGTALLDEAERLYRERCSGVSWELGTVRMISLMGAYYLGDLPRIRRELGQLLPDAKRREDLYLLTIVGTTSAPALTLLSDQPERCRHEIAETLGRWTYPGFSMCHLHGMEWSIQTHLYEGQGWHAHQRLAREASTGSRMIKRFVQVLRIEGAYLEGRCAVAAAMDRPARQRDLLIEAEKSIQAIAKEEAPWGQGLARTLQAGALALRGRPADALRELGRAESLLMAADLLLHATVVRRRRGQLLGGEEGRALFSSAETTLRDLGIVDPARFSALLSPGFKE